MLFCRQIRIAPGVTQTNTQTNKYQTRELGSSGPYTMLLCFFALLIVHVIRADSHYGTESAVP